MGAGELTIRPQLVRLKQLSLIGIVTLYPLMSFADNLNCNWEEDRSVAIGDGWIEASQGRDESSHRIRVAIWGPDRVSGTCEDLDGDGEAEVIVSSRGIGSGPYYRLQIIDFVAEGILSWSYRSDGVPMLKGGRIHLGDLSGRYQMSGALPEYSEFVYRPEFGLVDRIKEPIWFQFITIPIEDEEVRITGPEFRSSESCVASGEFVVQQFSDVGLEVAYVCQSNIGIQNALEAITN